MKRRRKDGKVRRPQIRSIASMIVKRVRMWPSMTMSERLQSPAWMRFLGARYRLGVVQAVEESSKASGKVRFLAEAKKMGFGHRISV